MAHMNAGDYAAARAADERAETIARRTADLLRELDAIERRIARLEALLCRNILQFTSHIDQLR